MRFESRKEGTRDMYGYPSHLRDSQAQVKRRHSEIFNGVQAERQAALARRATRKSSSVGTGFVVLVARQRLGHFFIAAGTWIGGLTAPTAPAESESLT